MKKRLRDNPEPRSESADNVWRSLGTVGTIGFTLVGCTFFGLGLGYAIDRHAGTGPWGTIVGLLLGIVAGFVNIFQRTQRSKRPS